jgi:hypothetical protein
VEAVEEKEEDEEEWERKEFKYGGVRVWAYNGPK